MLKVGALSLILFAACGVGDDGGNDPVGRSCTSFYKTTGKIEGQTAIPDNDANGEPDIAGCWPQGHWKFTAAPDPTSAQGALPTCSPDPTPLPNYDIQIDYGCYPAGKDCGPTAPPGNAGEYGFEVKMVTATTMRTKLKYSSGAGGPCQGLFELFSDDGLEVWNFHPTLLDSATLQLEGGGEFSHYDHDQWDQ